MASETSETCKKCGNPLGEVKRTWRICNKCWNEYHRSRKRNIINEYGGKCQNCGITDPDVLKVVRETVLCYNCHRKQRITTRGEV